MSPLWSSWRTHAAPVPKWDAGAGRSLWVSLRPISPIPPGRADIFSQMGAGSAALPLSGWGTGGRKGTVLVSTGTHRPTRWQGGSVQCTPWRRGPDSALRRCELSGALNVGLRRHYGGWESAKNRQCGFYMLRHAAPKFCITAFWSCSAANLGLCSNSKCIQKVAFRSRPAVKVSLREKHAWLHRSYYLISFPICEGLYSPKMLVWHEAEMKNLCKSLDPVSWQLQFSTPHLHSVRIKAITILEIVSYGEENF